MTEQITDSGNPRFKHKMIGYLKLRRGMKSMNINEAKILICDDSVLARKQIKDVILSIGSPKIFEAKDGEAGLEIYNIEKPDLVFLDIVMPKLDGKDVLKVIMKDHPSQKVVIVSSIGTQDVIMETLKMGATDFIQKPHSELQIINALTKALR